MAIRLVLVRHGLSSFNAKGLIQGRTDDSLLTDEGYEQARKAGKALSKINFDKPSIKNKILYSTIIC